MGSPRTRRSLLSREDGHRRGGDHPGGRRRSTGLPYRPRYSGKFVVRVSPSLHARLVVEATEQGVSLNQWVVQKLVGRPHVSLGDLYRSISAFEGMVESKPSTTGGTTFPDHTIYGPAVLM
ncbi:type II toxin-antitoxin system HicB family antitoxin [Mycobacterium sp. NPDC050441]|uniref:type II toxin-antitoxin system HicB family antitoxin n=1 Tax=Mycobacterium sp. NPDC050441 TaxID=3155403 RepID=UPI0033C33087